MVNSDFRVWGGDRGNYFPETDRIIIFLNQHETLDDLLSTITHEYIHFCIGIYFISSSFMSNKTMTAITS